MTYQALARKCRPKDFSQLIGQSAVSQALSFALTAQHLHHAYLFTGTRGVGKTTIARILAKCLNCETGVTATPCNTCSACIEMDAGCFPDCLEVDAASRTRIEDTKELLENIIYAPIRGRYKIYLIDEVHMLSGHSFNALLKTLEEPPEHVKFIFATTEPNRIPITVLSRCLHFNLRPFSITDLQNQLEAVLHSENINFETKAVSLLAQAAKGSSRDALSLLEQAIGVGLGQVRTESVENMLGLRDQALLTPLMQAICAQNITETFSITRQLAQNGADFERFLELLLESFQALNMMQMVPEAKTHIEYLKHIDETILELHPQLSPEQTQLYYQIALSGKRDLALMPDLSRAFEMVLLRMLCFKLEPDSNSKERVKLDNSAKSAKSAQTVQSGQVQQIAGLKQAERQSERQPERQSERVAEQFPKAQMINNITSGLMQSQSSTQLSNIKTASLNLNQTPNWRELTHKLALKGVLKLLAENCIIQKWSLPEVQLILDRSQEVFLSTDREKELSQLLSNYLNCAIQLKIQLQSENINQNITQNNITNNLQSNIQPNIQPNIHNSPAKQVQAEQLDKHQQAQALLANEQRIQTLMDIFDAKLMKVTLKDNN